MSIHLLLLLRGFEIDGPGRLVLSILRQWRQKDLRVSIVSFLDDGPLRDAFEAEAARLGGRVYTIKDDGLLVGRAGLRVANLAKMIEATHIHAHLLRPDIAGRRAARTLSLPYFVTEHGIHSWKEKALVLRPFVKAWYRFSLSSGMTICAVSRRVGRQLRREGIPRASIRIVENGIDLNDFRIARTEEQNAARGELGIPAGISPVVLVIGSLTHRKSPETALRGFAAFRRYDGVKARLLIAGDGPLKRSLQNLANRLWAEDAVHFAGQLSSPHLAYAAADMVLHTARDEPFGLIVAEALASGLPAIVRAGAGPDELVPPPPCSTVVEGEDAEAWASALHLMANRLNESDQIKRRCRLYAEKRFSITRTSERYLRLYRKAG